MHFNNAVHIPLLQVSQRNIVSVQEGKAGVVVLEVQAFAHSLGKLIDKAENALVFTGVLFIHKGCLEFQTDIGIRSLADRYVEQIRFAVDLQYDRFFSKKKTVIQHVTHFSVVYRDQIISASDADALGCGSFFHADNLYHSVTSRAF